MQLTREQVRRAPKVLLHDHLDGGLRPTTLLELADASGHRLPEWTPDALAAWYVAAASSGGLEGYLATFRHTVAVLQTPDALTRVAREAVLDLAEDGVVHVEIRWAPELHLADGLTMIDAVAAVTDGLARGAAEAGRAGRVIAVRQLLTAMRDADRSTEVARLAVAWRERGVVGFDLAGPEAGHPATRHAEAFATLREAGLPWTVHAGEAAGVESVRDAVDCGASRVGHGVRLVEELTAAGEPGPVAAVVRDRAIALEVCPTSNVQTGAVPSLADHPGGRLRRLGILVTVNTDNRLVSGTTLTDELLVAAEAFGWGWAELEQVSVDAAGAAFLPEADRRELVEQVLRPGWAAARA